MRKVEQMGTPGPAETPGDMLNEMNRCEAPQMLSPYLRRTKSIVELLPCLYLKGISTGDFQEALSSLPGEDALHDTGMAPGGRRRNARWPLSRRATARSIRRPCSA
jgi:hypothetical protein